MGKLREVTSVFGFGGGAKIRIAMMLIAMSSYFVSTVLGERQYCVEKR